MCVFVYAILNFLFLVTYGTINLYILRITENCFITKCHICNGHKRAQDTKGMERHLATQLNYCTFRKTTIMWFSLISLFYFCFKYFTTFSSRHSIWHIKRGYSQATMHQSQWLEIDRYLLLKIFCAHPHTTIQLHPADSCVQPSKFPLLEIPWPGWLRISTDPWLGKHTFWILSSRSHWSHLEHIIIIWKECLTCVYILNKDWFQNTYFRLSNLHYKYIARTSQECVKNNWLSTVLHRKAGIRLTKSTICCSSVLLSVVCASSASA